MSFFYSPNVVTNGIALCLDAANIKSYTNGSTVWRDLTSNNINGTLINGPTFSSANRGSILFDGTNDYVTLGTPAQLNAYELPITIMGWGKLTNSTGFRTFFSAYSDVVNSKLYNMIRIENGTFYFYASAPPSIFGSFQAIQSSFTVPTSVWNFFAVVVSGTTSSPVFTFYLNSASQIINGNPLGTSLNTTVDFRVGGNQAYPNAEGWAGNIANVFVYKRALTSNEVSQNYNALKGRYGL